MIDTKKMELSIPQEKIVEIKDECSTWLRRSRVSKKMLQSFLGKLLHVASCIRNAKKFTARLLATLRGMGDRSWTTIGPDFKADVQWSYEYASIANGIALYAPVIEYVELECDAA